MKDTNLHPTAERLQSYVEEALDAGDRAVLESHLSACSACRGEVEEWRSLFSVLGALPQFEPSSGFVRRVMARVTLPDPWYVRVPARVGARLQRFVPQTTRGWATATAFMSMPLVFFAAVAAWLLSKPYITSQGLMSFTFQKTEAFTAGVAQSLLASVLQSNAALFAARGLEAVTNAGLGAAGALAAAVSIATALSAWVLYQNLFRTTTRENRNYVSYSF